MVTATIPPILSNPSFHKLLSSPFDSPGDESGWRTSGDGNSSVKPNSGSTGPGYTSSSKTVPCDVLTDSSLIASSCTTAPTVTRITASSFSEAHPSTGAVDAPAIDHRVLSQKGPLLQKHKKKLQLLHEAQLLLEDAQKQQSNWASTRTGESAAGPPNRPAFDQPHGFINPESTVSNQYNLMPPLSPDIPSFAYQPCQVDLPTTTITTVPPVVVTRDSSEDEFSSAGAAVVSTVAFPSLSAGQTNSSAYSHSSSLEQPLSHARSWSPSTVGSGGGGNCSQSGRIVLKLSRSYLRNSCGTNNQPGSGSHSEADDAVVPGPTGGRTTKELTVGLSDTDRRRKRRHQRREERRFRKQQRRSRLKHRLLSAGESPPAAPSSPTYAVTQGHSQTNLFTSTSSSSPQAPSGASRSVSASLGVSNSRRESKQSPGEDQEPAAADRRYYPTGGKQRKRHGAQTHASLVDDLSPGVENKVSPPPPPPPPPLPTHWRSGWEGYDHHPGGSRNNDDDGDDDRGVNQVQTVTSPCYTDGIVRSIQVDNYDASKTNEEEFELETGSHPHHRNHPMSLLLSDDFDESLSRRSLFSLQNCIDSKVHRDLTPVASDDLFGDENYEDLADENARSFRHDGSLSADSREGEIESGNLSLGQTASDSVNYPVGRKNDLITGRQQLYDPQEDQPSRRKMHNVTRRFEPVEARQTTVCNVDRAATDDSLSQRSFSKPHDGSGSASKNISSHSDSGRESRKKARHRQKDEGQSKASSQDHVSNHRHRLHSPSAGQIDFSSPTRQKKPRQQSIRDTGYQLDDQEADQSHRQQLDSPGTPADSWHSAGAQSGASGRTRDRNHRAELMQSNRGERLHRVSKRDHRQDDNREAGKLINGENRRPSRWPSDDDREKGYGYSRDEDAKIKHAVHQKRRHFSKVSREPISRSPDNRRLSDIELSPLSSSPNTETIPQRTSSPPLADSPPPVRLSKISSQRTIPNSPKPSPADGDAKRRGKKPARNSAASAVINHLPDSSGGSKLYSNERAWLGNPRGAKTALKPSTSGQSDSDSERLEDLFDRLLGITQPQLASRMGEILLKYTVPANDEPKNPPADGGRSKTGVKVLYGEPPLVVAFNLRRLPVTCIDQLVDLVAENEMACVS